MCTIESDTTLNYALTTCFHNTLFLGIHNKKVMSIFSASNLKATQLRLIAALAQTGKLHVAAELLGIAQPAASRALAEIEALAGVPLFQRHPKGMHITPEGQIVAHKAHNILREMQDLGKSLSAIKTGLVGKVRIGAVTGPAVKYLVPAIRMAKSVAPELNITVEVAPSRQLLRELILGRLDFVLARILPEFEDTELEITPVGDELVSLLVRDQHPLSGREKLTLSEILEQEWLVQEQDNPIREAVNTAFYKEGLAAPKNIINSSSLLFAMGYLSGTDAIVAVSDEVAQLLIEEPLAARFSRLQLQHTIGVTPYFLLRLKNHSATPAAQSICDVILSQSQR